MSTLTLRDKILRRIEVVESGCWLWTGGKSPTGYGHVRDGKKTRNVHRALYEIVNGSVAPGLHLDHLCRMRLCVNPAHLEPVSARTNILRGISHAARNARKTHCLRGHEFSNDNLMAVPAHRGRVCKACARETEAARREKIRKEA